MLKFLATSMFFARLCKNKDIYKYKIYILPFLATQRFLAAWLHQSTKEVASNHCRNNCRPKCPVSVLCFYLELRSEHCYCSWCQLKNAWLITLCIFIRICKNCPAPKRDSGVFEVLAFGDWKFCCENRRTCGESVDIVSSKTGKKKSSTCDSGLVSYGVVKKQEQLLSAIKVLCSL